MNDDEEPNWDRIAAVCTAVLLRMIEDHEEVDDVDGDLLPGVDRRAGG